MDELWNAWAAGFVDGEGAIMLSRSNGQVYMAVRVGQAVQAPLDRLAMMYGGKVKAIRDGKYFEWQIYGIKALEALRKMRPFMMVKGAHVDLLEEYWLECGGRQVPFNVRLSFHERMSTMQHKANNKSREGVNHG